MTIWTLKPRSAGNRRHPEVGQGTAQILALRPDEAAAALSVSRSFFFAEILPELSVVRRGRLRLIPLRSLEDWIERNATRGHE